MAARRAYRVPIQGVDEMNRRNFLKGLLGTTIAITCPLPVLAKIELLATAEALDKACWWRANFTILNVKEFLDYRPCLFCSCHYTITAGKSYILFV